VPSEVRTIRTVAIQERKKKPGPQEARDIDVHARSLGYHNPKERLTKPQLHAVSERIAEITLYVNTTGYSRRRDDVWYVREAGANVLELGRRIGLCAESIVGARSPAFV
jgi:hypothetical protein